MPSSLDSLATQQLLAGIATDGYAIIKNFMPAASITSLADEITALQLSGEMRRAGTGKALTPTDDSIRGDFTLWLEKTSVSVSQQAYFAQMEIMRSSLNRDFYLGLFELESHFALYPPGALYRKHLDQFQGQEQRQISCILYLNQDWQPEHGGQLRMYLDGIAHEPYRDIEPIGGTLVAFLSGRFFHEVLPATHERVSLTGWFSTRSDRLQ